MDITHITHNGNSITLRRDGRNVYRVAPSRTFIIHRAGNSLLAALYIRDLIASDFGYRYPTRERRIACGA